MQCIDLHDGGKNPIHCPFCGTQISVGTDEENVTTWIVGECEHLLFAAVDGFPFEYQGERLKQTLAAALSRKSDSERAEFLEDEVEEVVALVDIPNAFMFQSIMAHPAQPDTYVAFAPINK